MNFSELDIANLQDFESSNSSPESLPSIPDLDNPDEAYNSDTTAENQNFYK